MLNPARVRAAETHATAARPGLAGARRFAADRPQARLRITLDFIGELILALLRSLRGRSAMWAEDLMFQPPCHRPGQPAHRLAGELPGRPDQGAYMGAAQLQRLGATSPTW